MARGVLPIALALAALGSIHPAVATSQGACRRADSVSDELIGEVAHFASATDPHDAPVRDSLRLPAAQRTEVHLVLDAAVCQTAAAAYAADRAKTGGFGLSGRVYVVKVAHVYVVLDPEFHYDATHQLPVRVVLDSAYRMLSVF